LKDAARLLAYFAAVLLLGALLAPPLFWLGQYLAAHHALTFLAAFDFETYFHRALLVAGLLLLWPLLRSIRFRNCADLQLRPDRSWAMHFVGGFLFAVIPLLCCGAALIFFHAYSIRLTFTAKSIVTLVGAATFVPLVEEALFRGLILGILLRSGHKLFAVIVTSAFFSIVHFLKAPEGTSQVVNWWSGFNSIAHAFSQFSDPALVLAGFTTLFLIGWILADSRLRTESLWLPIGLHAGWIFGNSFFNRIARRQILALPWLGKNLLVGLLPLMVCLVTWLLVILWLNRPKKLRN
jgi:uncharacterized protein